MLTRLMMGAGARGSGNNPRIYRIEPWANITGHVPTGQQLQEFAEKAGMQVVQAVQGGTWTLREAGTPLFGQADYLVAFRSQYLRAWDQVGGPISAPPWEPTWQAPVQEPMCDTIAGMVPCSSIPKPQPALAIQPAPVVSVQPPAAIQPAPQPQPAPAPQPGITPAPDEQHILRVSVVGGSLNTAWAWRNGKWQKIYQFDGMMVALAPEVFDLRIGIRGGQVAFVDVGNFDTGQWQRVQGNGSGCGSGCGSHGAGLLGRLRLGSGCGCAKGSGADPQNGVALAGVAYESTESLVEHALGTLAPAWDALVKEYNELSRRTLVQSRPGVPLAGTGRGDLVVLAALIVQQLPRLQERRKKLIEETAEFDKKLAGRETELLADIREYEALPDTSQSKAPTLVALRSALDRIQYSRSTLAAWPANVQQAVDVIELNGKAIAYGLEPGPLLDALNKLIGSLTVGAGLGAGVVVLGLLGFWLLGRK